MRIEIRNASPFQTRDLLRLFRLALRDDGILANGFLGPALRLDVRRHRNATRVRGLATLGGTQVHLWIGRAVRATTVLKVMAHEILHLRGLNHKEFGGEPGAHYDAIADDALPPLRLRTAPPLRPKADQRPLRYQLVLRHIREKEQRLRRTGALLKKWQRKRRYYERSLTAAGLLPAQAATTATNAMGVGLPAGNAGGHHAAS
jgi:hypothetical protein